MPKEQSKFPVAAFLPAMRALLGRKKASMDPTNATVHTLLIP
jgi:hypothetical protein